MKLVHLTIGALVALVALLALISSAEATNVGGTISVDTTWTLKGSPYVVTSSVTVVGTNGADAVTTLTIEPGVQVIFNFGTTMTIGGSTSTQPGALVAQGFDRSPILFTSNQSATRGYWGPLLFQGFSDDAISALSDVVIEYGGRSTGGLYLLNSAPSISRITVRESSTAGIFMSGSGATIASSTIHSNTGHGVSVSSGASTLVDSYVGSNGLYGFHSASSAAIPKVSGNTFQANGQRPILVHPASDFSGNLYDANGIEEIELHGGILAIDKTLPVHYQQQTEMPIPYHLIATLTVRGTDGADAVTTLTIAPGVEIRMARFVSLDIGTTSATIPGALVAHGEKNQPILLTSDQPRGSKTRGWWGILQFAPFSDDGLTSVSAVQIEYGGSSTGSVYFNSAQPRFGNNVVQESGTHGVYVSSSNVEIVSSTIQDNNGHGVFMTTGSARLTDSFVARNGQYGVFTNAGLIDVPNNFIGGNTQRPLRISNEADFTGVTFDGNGIQEIELLGGIMGRDQRLPRHLDATTGAPLVYIALGTINVRGLAGADAVTSLAVDPGVEVRFNGGAQLEIGNCCSASLPGALDAQGADKNPILFTSNQVTKTRGFWSGVVFQTHASDALSAVRFVTVEYAGSSGAGVVINSAEPVFQDNLVRQSSNHGVQVNGGNVKLLASRMESNAGHGVNLLSGNPIVNASTLSGNTLYGMFSSGGVPTVTGNAFLANAQRPLRINPNGDFAGNAYDGNGIQEIELLGAQLSVDRTLALENDATTLAPLSYVLTGSVQVYGQSGPDLVTTLTIEPGVEVRVAQFVQLDVGTCCTATSPGALDARGTAAAPIVFTSHQTGAKTRGYWNTIIFQNQARDALSTLENVVIEYGGRATAGLYLNSAAPALRDVIVRQSLNHGVYATGEAVTLAGARILDNGGYGVYVADGGLTLSDAEIVRSAQRPLRMPPGAALTDLAVEANTIQEIEVTGGTVSKDTRWSLVVDRVNGTRLPYVVTGDVSVLGTDGADQVTTLTLDPGVEVRMNQFRSFFIGTNAATPGALVARGTTKDPITITSSQAGQKARGYWSRIEFQDQSRASVIENATVEYGGYASVGAVYAFRSEPTIRAALFRGNAPVALHAYDTTTTLLDTVFESNGDTTTYYAVVQESTDNGRLTLQDVRIANSTGRALRIGPDAQLLSLDLAGSGRPGIEVFSGYVAVDTTWPKLAEHYWVTGDVYVEGADGADAVTTLTIEPDVTVQMSRYRSFFVGSYHDPARPGGFWAVGTAAAPITFTTDEAAQTKTAGYWSRVEFRQHASDAHSVIERAFIEGADYGVYSNGAAPTIRHNELRQLGTYAAYLDSASDAVIEHNTFSKPYYGVYAYYTTGLSLVGNTIATAYAPAYSYDLNGATIRQNTFTSDGSPFQLGYYSEGNLIADNSFVRLDGGKPVWDDNYFAQPPNAWNLSKQLGPNILGGLMLGGNHYSDYPGVDYSNPSDGLGDSDLPYVIGGSQGIVDPLPLAPPDRWIPDVQPPVSLATLNGLLTDSGWYRGAVGVTIDAEDDISGVAGIDFALDGEPYAAYGGPFNVATSGAHALLHFATDRAGNLEKPHGASFLVDASPPLVPIELDAAAPDDLCFWLNASDAHSGMAGLAWSLLDPDGAPVTNRNEQLLQDVPASAGDRVCADLEVDGRYRVRAAAEDVAGNAGITETDLLTLDLLPPVLEILRPLPNEIYLGATRVNSSELPRLPAPIPEGAAIVVGETLVIANASDSGLGVVRGELWVDGVPVDSDTHAPFRWWWGLESPGGVHVLTVKAWDGAGRMVEESRTVFLVSDPLERLAREQAQTDWRVGCVAAGAYVRLQHGTFTDLDVNRALAVSRADLALGIPNSKSAIAGQTAAPVLSAAVIESECEVDRIPAHNACGEAGALDVAIDLTTLRVPLKLDAQALHANACTDPAIGDGDAVRALLQGVAAGREIDQVMGDEPNSLTVLTTTPTALVPDPMVALLVLNEQSDEMTKDGCRRQSGSALRLVVLDPLKDFTEPSVTVVVGWVSTLACKMPSITNVVSTPNAPLVVPGTATRGHANVTGDAGQRTPTGSVAFYLCGPGESNKAGCATGAYVPTTKTLVKGNASSNATNDTVGVGAYCWRAAYAGDAYYYPSSGSDPRASCFRTGKQPAELTLVSNVLGSAIVPGTSATATGTVSGPAGMPMPTGTVTFWLCPPMQLRPELGAQLGGPCESVQIIEVGTSGVDGLGVALSPATTDTWAVGTYCWMATYSGDAFYETLTVVGGPSACFSTVRQPSTANLLSLTGGPIDPGDPASARVTVLGAGPTPTGGLSFLICTPGERTPGVGCETGGSYVGWYTYLDGAGIATSDPTTDTRRIGEHCWAVRYDGDGYYLPQTFFNAGAACFRVLNPCAVAGARFGEASTGVGTGYLAVGAPGYSSERGAVCVFDAQTGEYLRIIQSGNAGEKFGAALAQTGGKLLVGAPGFSGSAGRAYLIDPSTGATTATISNPSAAANDRFGASLAGTATRAIIGAPGDDAGASDAGAAHVFTSAGAFVHTLANPAPGSSDAFGAAVALVADGRTLVGAPQDDEWATDAGAVYLFDAAGALSGTLLGPEPTANDLFGAAIAVVAGHAAIGAPNDDAAKADAGAVHLVSLDTMGLTRTLTSPTPATGGHFGASAATVGDRALVGAPADDAGKGAAYLMSAATGALLHTFRDESPQSGALFGASLGVAGGEIVAGAPRDDGMGIDAGAAGFFADTTTPPLLGLPTTGVTLSTSALMGTSVATIESDVLVGAPGMNRAYRMSGSTGNAMVEYAPPAGPADDTFGAAVAADSGIVVIGAPFNDSRGTDAGIAYIHWPWSASPRATLTNPNARFQDEFGAAIDVEGWRVLVGAPGDDTGQPGAGAAYLFDGHGNLLVSFPNPSPSFNDRFGASVAIDGDRILIGAPGDDTKAIDAGAAYVFDAETGALVRTLYDAAPRLGDAFGAAVAWHAGDALVGAPSDDTLDTNAGAAFRYDRATGALEASYQKPKPSVDDQFGAAIVGAGSLVAIGAPGDDGAAPGGGAVHVLHAATGAHVQTFVAPGAGAADQFGRALAVRGSDLVVGAPRADTHATDAGAAYVLGVATGWPTGGW